MFWVFVAVTAIAGYLLGSLNTSIIMSSHFFKQDIRNYGSGNAGMTNTLRTYGFKSMVFVLVCDVAKTVLGCFIGGWLLASHGFIAEGRFLGGFFVVIGHLYPIYFRFKGGKGVLCGAAIAAMIDWRVFAVVIGVFLIITFCTRYVSLGSVVAGISFPFTMYLFMHTWSLTIMSIVYSLSLIFMHRSNIKRLFKGQESKISFRRKEKE